MYADDSVLKSPSPWGLCQLLYDAEKFGTSRNLKRNAKKSVVVITSPATLKGYPFPGFSLKGIVLHMLLLPINILVIILHKIYQNTLMFVMSEGILYYKRLNIICSPYKGENVVSFILFIHIFNTVLYLIQFLCTLFGVQCCQIVIRNIHIV